MKKLLRSFFRSGQRSGHKKSRKVKFCRFQHFSTNRHITREPEELQRWGKAHSIALLPFFRQHVLKFNPRTCRGVGGRMDPPWFFANNSRKTRRIAAKLTQPSHWSIWHILWKFQVDVMSGHQVMTSYVRSCSDEIGRFCDLSHNGARSFFQAYEYAFHDSLLVLMDV